MQLVVGIGKGKLSAHVVIPEGYQPTALEVRKSLLNAGVTYGFLEDVISQLGDEAAPGEYEVAKGEPAIQGEDASVEYFFRTGKPDLTPRILEDGKTDYFNLGVAENVPEGQVLARKKPAVPGQSGRAVTGEEILPKGVRDIPIRAGKGATMSADGLEVIADVPGMPSIYRGVISVSQIFVVEGDVDFSVGNIDFDGHVEVAGTVRNNFRVRAKGNIIVQGTVEGGILEAGGFIMVMGGVRQNSSLTSEGDIQVSFMEHSRARTPQNLFVKDDLLFSEVDVDGSVVVEGSLIGGQCKADVAVKADTFGSKMGTPTHVILAPREKWFGVLHQHEDRMTDIKSNLEKVEEGMRTLDNFRERYKGLHPDKEALYQRLSEVATGLKQETVEVTKLVMQAKAKCDSLPDPKIMVRKLIHPGVHVRLNDSFLHNESDLLVTSLYEAEGRIQYL
ncbi:MAG: DUF342 domain-containing protein [Candidatus Sericytochromatia bacterium]|nr:DUF342 domain-containing protein [Candidatus Tanganyikabacteria bacterium]